jgi:PAS domain S-box-containing protein
MFDISVKSLTRATDRAGKLLSSGVALVAGISLTLITLLLLCFMGWYEYKEVLENFKDRGELQARVLEDHATRTVETVSVALRYLAADIVQPDASGTSVRTRTLLSQALVGMPLVRSLAVVDANGLVLASTAQQDVGVQIALDRLGALPATGQEKLGEFVPGRSLAALGNGSLVTPTPAVGFIPLVRAQRNLQRQEIYLVALMNADAFSNFQLLTLDNPRSAAYLLSYQGRVLASSGPQVPAPGTSLAQHSVFRQYLPKIEHADYVGEGAVPGQQVVAFRLSKSRPLVVLVEHPYSGALADWYKVMRWVSLLALFSSVFLGYMTWIVWRSLRARENAYVQLGKARQQAVFRERELQVLVKSVQELIFRTDIHGVITYTNDRWLALRGDLASATLTKSLAELVEPDDRAAVQALFQRDGDAGVRTATACIRSLDGVSRRLDLAVVPLRNRNEVVGFAGSAVDVSERYFAEQALMHQLTFVGTLLEISPTPVATLNSRGQYTSVNRAWEEFTGYSRQQVIGHYPEAFMTPSDAAMVRDRDSQLWREGGTVRYEVSLTHQDGSRRDVVVTKVLVPGSGDNPASLLSSMMDVSEFRQAERATREAREAAEEASRAKSEFIANISHELRTPLQSILGFSELGVMRGRDSPKLQGMFNDIHASGVRMLALVNDLLDVSKIESSVGGINLERADLRGLVHSVLHELSPLLEAKHVLTQVQLGERPLIAKVDPVRFQQVVRNVVANAIKFSPSWNEIEVQGRVTEDRRICISVRDHGQGIPPGELEKIFGAFVQSSSSKDGSGGTGLGLTICKKIIEAHEGTVVAGNMPDGGAIFSIYLPARQSLNAETTY